MICDFWKVNRSNKIFPAKCVPRKNHLTKFTMILAHGIICEFTYAETESRSSAWMDLESCLLLAYSFYCLCTFVFTPIPYVLAHSLSVSLFPSSSSPELSVIMPRGKSYPLTSHLPAFHRSLARGLAGIQRERKREKRWDFLSACLDGHATVLFMPAWSRVEGQAN